jgi:hypothetical protein
MFDLPQLNARHRHSRTNDLDADGRWTTLEFLNAHEHRDYPFVLQAVFGYALSQRLDKIDVARAHNRANRSGQVVIGGHLSDLIPLCSDGRRYSSLHREAHLLFDALFFVIDTDGNREHEPTYEDVVASAHVERPFGTP